VNITFLLRGSKEWKKDAYLTILNKSAVVKNPFKSESNILNTIFLISSFGLSSDIVDKSIAFEYKNSFSLFFSRYLSANL